MTRRQRPALLLTALLALVAAFAVACSGDDGDDATATPTATPTPVTAEEVLEAAATRMEEVETFHFELTHENGSTQLMPGVSMRSAEGDVIVPDSMQMTAKASAGPVNVDISLIILPEGSFMTNPLTGRWEEADITLESVFDPASGVTGIMRAVQDAGIAGTENVNGVEAYRIEAMVDTSDLAFLGGGPGAGGDQLPARAWIGVDDPVVHRLEIEGAITESEDADLIRRLTLTNFDADIEITPPE